MGLDNTTLFVANIVILLVAVAAYGWVWLRVRSEQHWLFWIVSNLVLALALAIYAGQPELPVHMAVWPDALLLLGFGLRLVAARHFAGRATALPVILGPAAGYIALAMFTNSQSLNFALVNIMLALLACAVGVEFWRDRADGLPSRFGLVGVYAIMALSFAIRALQGIFAGEQIASYIPYDVVLEVHLLIALIHVAAGAVFVLSLASERGAIALRQAALLDSLTGLQNRRAFEADLRGMLGGPGDSGFALALFDIDHFKRINDRHGHAAGDVALRDFAQTCRGAVRNSDQLYRIGGEEFALLIAAVGPAEATAIAERVRVAANCCAPQFGGHTIALTASAGVCHASMAGRDFDSLLEAADAQLYQAKNSGRNQTIAAAFPANTRQPKRPAPGMAMMTEPVGSG